MCSHQGGGGGGGGGGGIFPVNKEPLKTPTIYLYEWGVADVNRGYNTV